MLFRDKHGYPIEYVYYRSSIKHFLTKALRLLLHTDIITTWRRRKDHYWRCENCSAIEFYEREIICWTCGKGEMIYKG